MTKLAIRRDVGCIEGEWKLNLPYIHNNTRVTIANYYYYDSTYFTNKTMPGCFYWINGDTRWRSQERSTEWETRNPLILSKLLIRTIHPSTFGTLPRGGTVNIQNLTIMQSKQFFSHLERLRKVAKHISTSLRIE